MTKKVIGLFVVLVVFVVFAKQSYASEFSLGIYPPIIQIDATPPTSIQSPIAIQNDSADPVTLSIQLKPFKQARNQNGQIEFLKPTEAMPGNDPLILQRMEILDNDSPTTSIVLAPQQEKKLILHIAIPKDEPSGDYYFSVLFLSEDQGVTDKTATNVLGGIATNVLLSIGPKTKTTGTLDEFSAPWFFTTGPVPFRLGIGNTSSHFIIPKGNIVIKNIFGQVVGKVNLLPVNVLANTSRFIPSTNTSDNPIWNEQALLGFYSAKGSILLSDEGPLFEKTIYFFALPASAMIGIVLVILFGVFIFFRLRERIKE